MKSFLVSFSSSSLTAAAVLSLFFSAACRQDLAVSSDEVFVSGRIEGDVANLSAAVPGRVEEVTVREGELVEKGQVLVRLSGDQIEAQRNQAVASLKTAQQQLAAARLRIPTIKRRLSQLALVRDQADEDSLGLVKEAEAMKQAAEAGRKKVEAELKQAEADARRYAALAEKEAVPKQIAEQSATGVDAVRSALDAARKQEEAAQGAVDRAKSALKTPAIVDAERAALAAQLEEVRGAVLVAAAQVEAAEAVVAQAGANVDDLVVRAPFNGRILTRAVEPGGFVGPGAPLLTLVDPEQLYLRGFIPEGSIGLVKVGQGAEVFLDSAPETPLAAKVLRVDPEAMFTPENTYFREDRVRQVVGVKLSITVADGGAKIGMPADGRILISERSDP